MTFVRQFIAAVLAASLVWTGSAGAMQSHTHEIDADHGLSIHAVTPAADFDHHTAAHAHDHDHHGTPIDHDDDGTQSDQDQPEHDKGISHVHSLCLVALEAQYPPLTRSPAVQTVEAPLLVVSLHTRSITPADRPPRTLL
jgi:hypothetical protein